MTAILDALIGGHAGPSGHIEWTAPAWVVFIAIGGGLLAWASSLPGGRSVGARLAEAIAWAVALASLAIALARPVWVEEEGRTEPARLAVLVDSSRSMDVLEDGKPRSLQADALIDSLAGPDVDFYHFGDDLAVGRPGKYDLPGTDLEGAMIALSERVAGDRLAGVVLISDGLDRGLLRERFVKEPTPARPPQLPGPLTVYQIGSPGNLHDLAVRSVDTGGFAFVRSDLALDAHITGLGYEGRTLRAQLLQDGRPVSTTDLTLDAKGLGIAHFSIKPDRAGRFTYSVQVPTWDDDAVPSNNVLPTVVRVVRDRMRVLQVAGTPSWDVKFLRRFLKGDPSVDLVSFFILRTESDLHAGYGERELSLIPFPHEKLFTDDLKTFDLVIFQDFDYAPYFDMRGMSSEELLGNIRAFVKDDGHAFAMIGGDRSFDLGQYANTPIADILPVQLGVAGPVPDRACTALCDATPFAPTLTVEGARHPITRLDADPAENAQWWSRLHPSDGTNLVGDAAPDAAVLLTHPTLKTPSGAPMPVLAVREVGKGRTLALTTDASWRWSFSEAAEGRGNQAYLRFWKNAFRWLVADPTAARVTVETARENYAVGDTVRIIVEARDPGFAPLPGAIVKAVVDGGGASTPIEGVTAADGQTALEWIADRRGALRVSVDVSDAKGAVGSADTVFGVTTRDPELDEVVPDVAFLQWVAESSGGTYYALGDVGPPVRDPLAGRTVWDRRETPVWRAPGLALIGALSAGIAWLVRRRAGLR